MIADTGCERVQEGLRPLVPVVAESTGCELEAGPRSTGQRRTTPATNRWAAQPGCCFTQTPKCPTSALYRRLPHRWGMYTMGCPARLVKGPSAGYPPYLGAAPPPRGRTGRGSGLRRRSATLTPSPCTQPSQTGCCHPASVRSSSGAPSVHPSTDETRRDRQPAPGGRPAAHRREILKRGRHDVFLHDRMDATIRVPPIFAP